VRWKLARKHDLSLLKPFLLAEEWKSVALAAYFHRQGVWKLPPRTEASVYFCVQGGNVAGVLVRNSAGLLLPLSGDGGLRDFPAPVRAGGNIYSLMGMSEDVRWLESRLTGAPEVAVDYHHMILRRQSYTAPPAGAGSGDAGPPPVSGLSTRLAGVADLDALFPLQKSYELEEVVLRPEHFRDQACYLHLKRTLKTQITCLAEISGSVVAKAGTNARALNCAQVGGVYTLESYRNRGIAFSLMQALLKRIFQDRTTVTLFVKTGNAAAASLYRRLGFDVAGGYRISYFRP
jgi:GNAT superfamily N-acetyltransferase